MNAIVLSTIGRYMLGYIGTALTSHGLVTGATWETIAGVVAAVVPAAIGAMTSTNAAAIKRVNGIAGVKAVPEDYPADATLANPNAR